MKPSELTNYLNQLPVKRLRAENIVSELISSGYCKLENIVIRPEHSSAYFFERDVREVEELINPTNGHKWFRISTPHGGLYDNLPERLFHRPVARVSDNQQWEDIKAEETKQEAEARRFFLLFDDIIAKQKVAIEQFESQALDGQHTDFLDSFLSVFWPQTVSFNLTPTQKHNLFQLTIVAHQVAGNIESMEEFMGLILTNNTKIAFKETAYNVPVTNVFPSLGQARLGVDSILVCGHVTKYKKLNIQIGPLSYEEMAPYFPNGSAEKLLHFLCGLLIPVEIDYDIEYLPLLTPKTSTTIPNKPATLINFTLNPTDGCAVLGYTTTLA